MRIGQKEFLTPTDVFVVVALVPSPYCRGSDYHSVE